MKPFLKPSWNFERIFLKQICDCLFNIFSNILDIIGRILTGLKLSFWFLLPLLKIVVIFACFNKEGHFDDSIASLKNIKFQNFDRNVRILGSLFVFKFHNLIKNISLFNYANIKIFVWKSLAYCCNTRIFTIFNNWF